VLHELALTDSVLRAQLTLAPLDVNLGLRRITMKFKRNLSTVQRLTLGLLIALRWVGVAQAAPVYQGKFALPYTVHWGQAVLPAGEYRLGFQDVGRHVFVVIEDAESHQVVALVPATLVGESRGGSVLLIAGEGNRRVVQSLSLAELGQAFTYYWPVIMHRTKGVQEAHATESLQIMAVK